MRKFIVAMAVLGLIFSGQLMAAEKTVEKVVVEKSPFSAAKFLISGHGTNDDNPERLAALHAQYFDKPDCDLAISFSDVIKEMGKSDEIGIGIDRRVIKFYDVEIMVDHEIKGMALSYERKLGISRFENVIIYVPTLTDKIIWENAAANFYERYTAAFWRFYDKKLFEDRARIEASEIRKRELERLRQGPILVYPSQ